MPGLWEALNPSESDAIVAVIINAIKVTEEAVTEDSKPIATQVCLVGRSKHGQTS